MRKTITIFLISILTLFTACTSSGDFATSGTASNNPLYIQWVNDIDSIVTVNQSDVTGWPGLLADDQHVIDSEVVSAIEDAGLTITNTSGRVLLRPPAGKYAVIGSGATNHGLNSNDDLLITGKIEIDGSSYWDTQPEFTTGMRVWGNQKAYFGTSANYWWTYDQSNNRLALGTTDSDGVGTNADIIRIPDGQTDVLFNSSVNQSAFDKYDDAELLRQVFSENLTSAERKLGRDKLHQVGVIKRINGYYTLVNGEIEYIAPFEGYSFASLNKLLAGAIYQSRDKINELEARITELERRLK